MKRQMQSHKTTRTRSRSRGRGRGRRRRGRGMRRRRRAGVRMMVIREYEKTERSWKGGSGGRVVGDDGEEQTSGAGRGVCGRKEVLSVCLSISLSLFLSFYLSFYLSP
jgi:hypothetical protein